MLSPQCKHCSESCAAVEASMPVAEVQRILDYLSV